MAKDAVEDYRPISIKYLKRRFLRGEAVRSEWAISYDTLRWTRDGEPSGSVDVCFHLKEGTHGTMRLEYTHTNHYTGEKAALAYDVQLVTTPCHYGRVRWWFLCPISRGGRLCGRRVGVLYLGKYAGCRQCHDLVYQSSKDSHKFDSFDRKLGIKVI